MPNVVKCWMAWSEIVLGLISSQLTKSSSVSGMVLGQGEEPVGTQASPSSIVIIPRASAVSRSMICEMVVDVFVVPASVSMIVVVLPR